VRYNVTLCVFMYSVIVGRLEEALSAFAALKKISPNSSIVVEGEEFYKKQALESSWTIRKVWLYL